MIILRSFSILPSHSVVGTSETGYHYYLRSLQRYHICNILQGVYEVLLCRRIQTNQIGTMYEPFSCRIWSFANAEQQVLLISMLIFTFVLSMLLRWIVLRHSAIWKSATSDFFYCITVNIYKGLVLKFTQEVYDNYFNQVLFISFTITLLNWSLWMGISDKETEVVTIHQRLVRQPS